MVGPASWRNATGGTLLTLLLVAALALGGCEWRSKTKAKAV